MKRFVRVGLLLLLAILFVIAMAATALFWRRLSVKVDRPAENAAFFTVFSEAENRPLSVLGDPLFTGIHGNADLYGYGARDRSYERVSAEEERELKDRLAELTITRLPEDHYLAAEPIGYWNGGLGFRNYSLYFYRATTDEVPCLFVMADSDSAYYRIEDEEAAARLEETWQTLLDRHPVAQTLQPEDFARKIAAIRDIRVLFYRYRWFLWVGGTVLFAVAEGLIWFLLRPRQKGSEPVYRK